MPTYHADDVTNEPTGAVSGPSEPVTTRADWVPEDDVETKVVAAPKKSAPRKQSRAEKK